MALTMESVQLLKAATKDTHGRIINTSTFGGEILQTNGENFTVGADARALANWRDALEQLLDEGLIERAGSGTTFQVTKRGYDFADTLEEQLL